MRFSVPRSESPSPVRRQARQPRTVRSGSTFGLPPDSDDDYTYDASGSESDSVASSLSSSSDSFVSESESDVPPPPPKPRHAGQSLEDQFHKEDTIASIRLRVRHKDAYEEWEHQTRRDAFVTARHEQTRTTSQLRQSQRHSRDNSRLVAIHNRQLQEVEATLASLKLAQETEEQKLRAQWQERDKQLWDRIENVIKFEENKVKTKLEAERKKREEEERRRKEEELKRRLAEEKQKAEVEQRRREAEEQHKEMQRQAQELQRNAELEKQKAERAKAEEMDRKRLGTTTADDDWANARGSLKKLKEGPIKAVKANRELKSRWNAARRQITPKVGQLTDDIQTINRVSQEIIDIMRPNPPHPREIYLALLSSLSKAILLQAEAEVTAEKRSAGPLAQLTANLLWNLETFPQIFWAKLVQRTGPWPVPSGVTTNDIDGRPLSREEKRKIAGWRTEDGKEETPADRMIRISGLMRVYFSILFARTPKPLDPMYRLPRFWTWIARNLAEPKLMASPVCPELLHTALEVGGEQAKQIWGTQWNKLLAVMYEGVTTGLHGTQSLIGGTSPEGIAPRARLQLEIERLMGAGP